MHFMAVRKSRKHFGFVVYSCFTNGSFTAAKIDGKFTTCYVKGVPFVSTRYTKGAPFLSKMAYIYGIGPWDGA